jgi:thiamine-phosphate pyrophosphorylase
VTRGTRTRVVVNERVDVAIACGADGVHLRADSLPAAAVRAIAPPAFLIGRSVHTATEARASGTAVDYLLAGTVWPTQSKPLDYALLGVTGLAGIVAAAAVPVLAIGGVTIERAGEAAAAGAAGVASIGLFQGPEHGDCRTVHLTETVSRLRRLFDTTTPAS